MTRVSVATADVIASTVAAERTALVAGLIRLVGDWELAEDCVQDAVERALLTWPVDGVPRSPAAWLSTVSRNRALDVLRRRTNERAKLAQRAILERMGPYAREAGGAPDDRLSLLFTCCHPALSVEAQVALTLKTVAGLTTAEIARAFLVPEATMSKRLLRTKSKIAHAGIPYRVPPPELLVERLTGVLAVVYLIVNEGYGRRDDHLAAEGLRLSRLLVTLMPSEDEVHGLLALVLLQYARRTTRFDEFGDLVAMEDQDRARWDRDLIDEGARELARAVTSGRPAGPYRLQAQIALAHASATTPEGTDWASIVGAYDALLVAQPSPVVALNHAVAVGFRDGWSAGLLALDELEAESGAVLAGYYLLPAARADFLRRLDRGAEAMAAYDDALALVEPAGPEARLLHRRRASVAADSADSADSAVSRRPPD